MFAQWVTQFSENAAQRARAAEPDWASIGALPAELVRSIQKFQTGEDGDGASLIRKSAADPVYQQAVRLFVAEEQNHARLLRELLHASGNSTIAGHWSDKVFVSVRQAFGLRLELATLLVAEVVALRYYRALRDGAADPIVADTAGRILADEQQHVPFHTDRLRQGFANLTRPARLVLTASWWILLLGATTVVALDHGKALAHTGVSRIRFIRETAAIFGPTIARILG